MALDVLLESPMLNKYKGQLYNWYHAIFMKNKKITR